jgi:Ras-related protein Rab-1A
MDDCGTPINKGPTIFDEDLDLYKLFKVCELTFNKYCKIIYYTVPTVVNSCELKINFIFQVVHKLGGYNRVTNQSQWKLVTGKLNLKSLTTVTANHVKQSFKK